MTEVIDLPGLQKVAFPKPDGCGGRTPQLQWSRRPSKAQTDKPPPGRPSVGRPRAAEKRKCVLLADVNLDH